MSTKLSNDILSPKGDVDENFQLHSAFGSVTFMEISNDILRLVRKSR